MNISMYTTKYPWLVAVVIGGLFYLLGQYLNATYSAPFPRDLSVNGIGEVEVKPDIATITLGVTTGPQATAKVANDMLAQKITAVLTAVESAGVSKDDTKTANLTINPIYEYRPDGRQVLRGFEGSQQVEVKIRNLDAVGDIVSRTTTEGVNQVGGINFTVDKPEDMKQQAEAKAIEDAKAKAKELASSLGVKIKRVKYYSSNSSVPGQPDQYLKAELGGAGGISSIPTPGGTQTITVNATITYEIR